MAALAGLVSNYDSESDGEDPKAKVSEESDGDEAKDDPDVKERGKEDTWEGSGEDEDEDEDEEEHETEGGSSGGAKGSAGNTALPSVDELFASTSGPGFLSAPGGGGFEVKAMRKRPAPSAAPAPPQAKTAKAQATPAARVHGASHGDSGGAGPAGHGKLKAGAAGPQGAPTNAKGQAGAAKDKKTAKDRVKGQRLKGQAGIGEDFRTWKTDLEMTFRQNFDS